MTSNSSGLSIRQARQTDSDALFEICLKTADSGNDATALYSDPHLPGYLWAAAYGALEPDFAFLLVEGDEALGYVIATPDTAAFVKRLETEWWPEVRRKVAGLVPSLPGDADALKRIANPEEREPWFDADYPAHLHINLLPKVQSGGWGRRMIETELNALRAAGVRGIHLGVSPTNERAKGFYKHIGFDDLSSDGRVRFGMILNP